MLRRFLLTGICDLLPDTFLSHVFPFFPEYENIFFLLGFVNSFFLRFLSFNVITSELFLSLTIRAFPNNTFLVAVGGVLAERIYYYYSVFSPYLLKCLIFLFLLICNGWVIATASYCHVAGDPEHQSINV